jgi:hypothetical protein
MSHQPGLSDDSTPDRIQRNLFAWCLLAGVLLMAVLAGPFFAGRVYTRDDLGGFHLPTRAFYARQLARGEPFDWMPHLFSGFYLTGEGQAGTYHPLHAVLYRCLPLRAALGWEWLGAYPAMLAGTWLFLRRRLARRDAAMLGSLLFTFSSFNLLHFIHPNAVAVVAHIPWLLWAIDVVLVDSRPWKVALCLAAIALLTGSQLLLGYPQYVWFSLLAEAAYATFVLVDMQSATGGTVGLSNRESRTAGQASSGTQHVERSAAKHKRVISEGRIGRPGGRWSWLVIAKGCGLLLGGVQLLPTVDALAHSARSTADAAFADWGSLDPLNLVQLVAPYMFTNRVVGENTHELGLYAGAVPLMLIVYLVVRRKKLDRLRRLAYATGGFALVALVLALGKHGPLYHLQSYLPLVGSFRFPCRYLVLCHLAVAVTAAIGFVLLVRDHQRSRARQGKAARGRSARRAKISWRRFGALWAVVALSGVVALVGLVLQDRPWTAPVYAVLAGPLLLAAAAVLVALAAGGVRFALVGLILFAAADLGVYGLSYAVYPHTARLEQFIASVPTPPTAGKGRVIGPPVCFDEPGLRTGNQIILAGWRRADGYAGLEPRRRLDYRRLPALRAAGVRWVMRGEASDRIPGLIPHDRDWLEVPGPLPRVRLVSRAKPSQDPARDIERIALESTVLTEVPLVLPKSEPGRAAIVTERPGRLHIQCNSPKPQLLVVAESFHHGWQATVDGRRQPVFRVNGDFMGCLVGPGRQQVVFEFRPGSLRRGRIVSCLGLVLVVVCFFGYGGRPALRMTKEP